MCSIIRKVFSSLVLWFFSSSVLWLFGSLVMPLRAEAGIVLKVIAVNPSKEYSQKVTVRAFLPKEAKPEDIIDKEDLEVTYDTQQGSYYVSGEYELKPGEVLEKNIELRDIWVVPSSEIESIHSETTKLANMLKNTEFADRIEFLRNNIESKINQVIDSQKNSPANPEKHISEYRDNMKIMESVKADLALARSMLSQVKSVPTAVVWKLVLAIIAFLGILGGSFYFIWQKQMKVIIQDATFYVPEPEGVTSSEDEKGGASAADVLKDKPQ